VSGVGCRPIRPGHAGPAARPALTTIRLSIGMFRPDTAADPAEPSASELSGPVWLGIVMAGVGLLSLLSLLAWRRRVVG